MPPFAPTAAALLVGGAALAAGWPARVNATFPFVELGRARPGLWEPAWLAASLLLFAVARRRPFDAGHRALGVLACVALLVWPFVPAKVDLNLLAPPAPGLATSPVLGQAPQVWTRATGQGNAFSLLAAEVRNEWTLMDLAGGINEEIEGPSALRRGVWGGMKAVATFAVAGRVAVLPLAAWIAWGLLRNREGHRVETGLLRALVYAVPAANLLALAICTVGGLPDDAGLRGRALLVAAGWLGVVGFVDAAGHRWR